MILGHGMQHRPHFSDMIVPGKCLRILVGLHSLYHGRTLPTAIKRYTWTHATPISLEEALLAKNPNNIVCVTSMTIAHTVTSCVIAHTVTSCVCASSSKGLLAQLCIASAGRDLRSSGQVLPKLLRTPSLSSMQHSTNCAALLDAAKTFQTLQSSAFHPDNRSEVV